MRPTEGVARRLRWLAALRSALKAPDSVSVTWTARRMPTSPRHAPDSSENAVSMGPGASEALETFIDGLKQ